MLWGVLPGRVHICNLNVPFLFGDGCLVIRHHKGAGNKFLSALFLGFDLLLVIRQISASAKQTNGVKRLNGEMPDFFDGSCPHQ